MFAIKRQYFTLHLLNAHFLSYIIKTFMNCEYNTKHIDVGTEGLLKEISIIRIVKQNS